MAIFILLIIQWYTSLFFQSVFHHRYAAHGMFTMSRGWEKIFYVGCFLTQGSSYISAYTYGLMHRMHHAHTDTEHDPHSPHYSTNVFMMMWDTRNVYHGLYSGAIEPDARFTKGLPNWVKFDKLVHNWVMRVTWSIVYIIIFAMLATAWWQFLFLPISFAMGAIQGVSVNWWAHKFGYENYKMSNTSKNILPIDFIFWGEAYHNNHHKHPGKPNNAHKWFEFDFGYAAMKTLHKLGVIKLKAVPAVATH